MKLTHSCIITEDIERSRTFYRDVLQIEPQHGGDYVEFPTEGGTLSLFHLSSHEKLAPGSMQTALNRSIILEFQVADVDKEYARLHQMNIEWVKPSTTQP